MRSVSAADMWACTAPTVGGSGRVDEACRPCISRCSAPRWWAAVSQSQSLVSECQGQEASRSLGAIARSASEPAADVENHGHQLEQTCGRNTTEDQGLRAVSRRLASV